MGLVAAKAAEQMSEPRGAAGCQALGGKGQRWAGAHWGAEGGAVSRGDKRRGRGCLSTARCQELWPSLPELAWETPRLGGLAVEEATQPCQQPPGTDQGELTVPCPLPQHPAPHRLPRLVRGPLRLADLPDLGGAEGQPQPALREEHGARVGLGRHP